MTNVIERETQPVRFLRLPEVLDRTGLSRSTIYVRLDQGRFSEAGVAGGPRRRLARVGGGRVDQGADRREPGRGGVRAFQRRPRGRGCDRSCGRRDRGLWSAWQVAVAPARRLRLTAAPEREIDSRDRFTVRAVRDSHGRRRRSAGAATSFASADRPCLY